ncbi:MAG TPA: cytochrome C oxidase subunit IV family protein [Myxococcales bacterium]|nr:cytochrome C oxidase subunit IV family protein [Myxococcales bacterium]
MSEAAAAHESHATRKTYVGIFIALAVLTGLEIALVKTPGIGKDSMVAGLIFLAVTKAALVGLYFMHLKWETKVMKWMVAVPLATPALYAVVLIADAMWRRT